MPRKNNPNRKTQARKAKQKAQRKARAKGRRVIMIDTPGRGRGSSLALR